MRSPSPVSSRVLTAALLAAATAAGGAAVAEQRRLELDPERTEVSFELGATLHTVEGTARLTEGVVTFDPESGTASGSLVVDASSADTDNDKRDRDMHVKVLESEDHPRIVFRPTAVRGDVPSEGEGTVEVDGVFSIHGAEHELTVDAVVRVAGDEVEAEVEFEVPYVDWGMKDPSKLLLKVDKKVTVRIRGVGTLTG